MDSSQVIRAAEARDAARIAAIYAHWVFTSRASFEIEPPGETEMERRRLEIAGRGLPYLVAEYRADVVGYAYASPYRSRPAYRLTVEDSVYIDSRFTGQGYGRLLLGALIDRCGELCYRQMVAIIGGSDNTGSIRLHESLGFRHVGVLEGVGFKFGQPADSVLMQRALSNRPHLTM